MYFSYNSTCDWLKIKWHGQSSYMKLEVTKNKDNKNSAAFRGSLASLYDFDLWETGLYERVS